MLTTLYINTIQCRFLLNILKRKLLNSKHLEKIVEFKTRLLLTKT